MNVRPSKFLWRSISLAAVISVCLAASAHAQAPLTYTWINPATGGVWSDPTQWADINADGTGDVADGANNTANFGTLDLTANNTISMDNDHTLGNLIFGDITPSNDWIVNAGTSPVTGLPSVLTLSTTLPNTTPTITVNNRTVTLNPVIAGTQGFNKNGTGTLVLSTGIDTITGNININAGALSFLGATAAVPASVQFNLNPGATLTYSSANNVRNVTMATQANVVNSIGSNSTSATLNGTGFTNAATAGTAAVVNYLVTGNGNVNWGFGALNIINTNMFQNFGGTVSWGANGTGTRVNANSSTQTMPFATIDLGTSTASLNPGTGRINTFIMGNLAGGSVVSLGISTASGNNLIVGSNNSSQTFSGRLFQAAAASAVTSNVNKVGVGSWTISPTSAYSNNALLLNANGGTLVADFSNIATPTNLFTAASTLSFGGGTFSMLAKSTGATAQTFGAITVNNGGGKLLVNTNGGTGATLTLGAITATAVGGALNISSTGTGTVAITSTGGPDATGTFGGKVTMTSSAGVTDWAASSTAAAPFTLSNYAAYTTLPTTTTTDTTNDLATGNVTLAGAITTNSLKVANTAASQALNLGGNALTLTNGGLLATGANAYAINNGTITSGLATTPNVTLHAYGAAPLTVGATVVDSAVGPTALTKAGPGTVVLSGNSTYTGQTFLTAGTTSIATDHPLGGGNGTILIASSDPINLGPSVTLASATLPPGFGVGSTLLGSTVTAITGTSVTLSVAANTALTNQNASWANAPQVTLNGGILSASASMSLTETGSGGSTPASTANRNLAIGSGGGMLDVASGATFSVPGTISVATTNQFGPLVKTGAGTLAVAATPAVNFNITTAATVTTATVDNVTGLVVGQTITGTGIPNNATITAIDPVNKIVTLSVAATAGDGTTAVPAAAYVANSYGGATILSGGTVSTAILTNGGLNSGVGSSSAAAPALVLDGGFLQYTGSGGLTGTTNRTFTLTSNGGGLDATGNTGAVVFSNTAPIVPDTTLAGSGARTLTLTGTSTLANTLAAQIIDSSATSKTSLTKSGAGTWILSNPASTYTGNTMVTGGGTLKLIPVTPSTNNIASSSLVTIDAGSTLDVTGLTGGTLVVGAGQTVRSNGSLLGSVTVPAGGTLGGSGTVGNAGAGLVTIQDGGFLSPGNLVGNLTVDKLSLSGAANLNFDFQTTPSSLNDMVTTGNLTLGGGFNLFKAGTTAQLTKSGQYELIHYTGTLTGFDSSWSTVSGTNPHVLNPVSGLNYKFDTTTNPGFITLTVGGVAPAEWNVDDSTHNWSDPNSWTTSPPNAVGAVANFLTAITAPRTVNVDAPQTVGVINFNNANKYTLSGSNKITFSATGSGFAQIIDANGSHQISTPLGLTSNLTIAVTNAGDTLTLSGGIPTATSSFIAKSGPGTLVLSGTNNYSGGTNVAGGTVQFAGLSSLGSGAVNLDSGTLKWATGNTADVSSLFLILTSAGGTLDTNGNNVTLSSPIGGGGAGVLTKAGVGKLIIAANATYTGGTNITGGTVQIGNNNSGSGSLNAGNITIGVGATLDINRTDNITLANNIGGASGTLNKNNSNMLTLSGANTFGTTAGGINLNAGTLQAGSSTGINGAGLTMAPSTTLDLNNFNAAIRSLSADSTDKIINAAPAVNFNITTTAASNSATVDNAAGLAVGQTIFGAGIPANTTITAITGTTLTLSANATAGATVPAAANGTSVITLNLAANTTYAGLLSNSADGTGALSLTKGDIGNLTLTANNSMTGAVTLAGGGLILPAGGKLDHVGTVTISSANPATMTISGGSLTAAGLATLNSGSGNPVLVVSSGSATFNGGLTATGNTGNNSALINVTGGSLTAASLNLSRTGNIGVVATQTAAGAGDTGDGLYIQGGTVNVTGALSIGTDNRTNSTASARIDGGSLTVGGATTIAINNTGRWSILDVNSGGTFTSTDTVTGVQLGGAQAGSTELLVRGTGVANVQKVKFGSTDIVQTGVVGVGVGGTNTGGTLNVGAGGLSRGVPMTSAGVPNMTAQVQLGENALLVANASFSSDADWLILGAATGATNGPTIQAADASGAPHDITITGALNGAPVAATTVITGPMLTKTGGGTLTLATLPTAPGFINATGTAPPLYSGKLAVNQGAFVLGQPNILPLVPNITLAAGTRFGTGSTDQNVLGTLIVAGNATLDLGAGGLVGVGATGGVHFASSGAATTGVPWAGTLTIQNWTNGFDHLFFGADSTGLDATQVSAITFAGLGPAKINATTGEITPVTPGPVYKRGDLTLDGHVNAADLTAMVSALANPATYEASHSLTNDSLFAIGDMDADGHFTNLDLQSMITFLQSGQGSLAPVPEPATLALAGMGLATAAVVLRRRRKQN